MIQEIFKICDEMIKSCDIDFNELKTYKIENDFFDDYKNIRIVNSFLFNFSKLQDKIGAKLFRQVLYELKEIDNENLSMIDILNLLEKLEILQSVKIWNDIREVRNSLAHEYPFDIDERVRNIQMAISGYDRLKEIYTRLKSFYENKINL